jgi:hypothetical protein
MLSSLQEVVIMFFLDERWKATFAKSRRQREIIAESGLGLELVGIINFYVRSSSMTLFTDRHLMVGSHTLCSY